MNKLLTLKTMLEFLDMIEDGGDWLWNYTLMRVYFSAESDASFSKKIEEFIEAGLIVRITDEVYANPRSKHRNVLYQVYDIARMVRWKDLFYESFESRACEIGVISQVPNRLTFATTGESGMYDTAFGLIEFIHKDMDKRWIKRWLNNGSIKWNQEKKVLEADEKMVIRDLKTFKRSLDLLYESREIPEGKHRKTSAH